MKSNKLQKFTRIFLLLCFTLSLTAIKSKAANPEWLYYENVSAYPAAASDFADDGEYMWIGIAYNGIYKFHKETQIIVDSIRINMNGCVVVRDNYGVFWIGGGGVTKYDGNNKTNYNELNSELPDNNVLALKVDPKGNLWVGTEKGLAKFDGTSWTVYNTKNSGIPDNSVVSIAIDKGNDIWIATYLGGLAKFDGDKKWTIFNKSNSGIPSNYLSTIVFDKSDNLWIGSDKGLTKYDGDKWMVYDKSNSELPDTVVTTIAIDSSNNIWIGRGGTNKWIGLGKFDGIKDWTFYTTSNSGLKSNGIDAITIDKVGNKWIGSSLIPGFTIFKENGVILSAFEKNYNMDSKIAFVYPNPVMDQLKILNFEFNIYSISDLEGRVLLNGITYNNEINVVSLRTGLYFICLKNGTIIKYLKFIKN